MDSDSNIHDLSSSRKPSDAERAAELRNELRPHLDTVCEIITKARREGLMVSFNMTADQFGIMRPGNIDVTRPL
jgi:hypothetical protein